MICVHDPVGMTEISKRFNFGPTAIQNWRLRFPDFPEPVITLSMGSIWEWSEVAAWAAAHGKLRLREAL